MRLQPKMEEIRLEFKDDPRPSGNDGAVPARDQIRWRGCLPILVRFRSSCLYKVLFVTISAARAPFFGWLRDRNRLRTRQYGPGLPWDPAATR
jgi:hypothetical protein